MSNIFWITLSFILLLAAVTFAALFLIFAAMMVCEDRKKAPGCAETQPGDNGNNLMITEGA